MCGVLSTHAGSRPSAIIIRFPCAEASMLYRTCGCMRAGAIASMRCTLTAPKKSRHMLHADFPSSRHGSSKRCLKFNHAKLRYAGSHLHWHLVTCVVRLWSQTVESHLQVRSWNRHPDVSSITSSLRCFYASCCCFSLSLVSLFSLLTGSRGWMPSFR